MFCAPAPSFVRNCVPLRRLYLARTYSTKSKCNSERITLCKASLGLQLFPVEGRCSDCFACCHQPATMEQQCSAPRHMCNTQHSVLQMQKPTCAFPTEGVHPERLLTRVTAQTPGNWDHPGTTPDLDYSSHWDGAHCSRMTRAISFKGVRYSGRADSSMAGGHLA